MAKSTSTSHYESCTPSLSLIAKGSETIDRSQLIEALDLKDLWKQKSSKNVLFWHENIQDVFDPRNIECLYVKGAGAVNIPLSLKDADVVKQRWTLTKNESNHFLGTKKLSVGYGIEGNEIVFVPKGKPKTTSELLHKLLYNVSERLFDIDFTHLNVNIEAHCDQLVFCEKGQSYEVPCGCAKETGMFGTLIVQIPVVTEQPSGRITWFSFGTQEYETCSLDSNEAGHFAAMARWCNQDQLLASPKFVIQSHPEGVVAVLVFNLVWVEYLGSSRHVPPAHIPEYFIRALKISKVLAAWKPRNLTTERTQTIEDIANGDENNEFQSKVNARETDFLCLPLDGLEKSGLSSWKYQESDGLKMKILSLINFIDVDVADMSCSSAWFIQQGLVNKLYGPEYHSIKISWDQPNQPDLMLNGAKLERRGVKRSVDGCKIGRNRHLVGEFKAASRLQNNEPVHFKILLIRPKMLFLPITRPLLPADATPSIGDLLKDNILDRLSSCKTNSDRQAKQGILRDFDHLMDLIEPLGVDYVDKLENPGAFVSDLLKICAALKAEEQCLRAVNYFFNVYGETDWWFTSSERYYHGPMYHLADIICFVSNWKAVCKPLLEMMESVFDRSFLHLADMLLDRGCLEGVVEMIDNILSKMTSTDEKYYDDSLEIYGDDLILLAFKLDVSAEDERSKQILSLVKRLSSDLVTDCMRSLKWAYKTDKMASRWILDIWDLLSERRTRNPTLFTSEHFLEIANAFIQIGKEDILEAFCNDIFRNCLETPTKCLFYDIITLSIREEFEKCYLLDLEDRVKVLKRMASFPSSKETFLFVIEKSPFTDEFNAGDIVEIFRFAQFLDGADELIEKFDSLFAKMDEYQLGESAISIFVITKITNRGTTTSRIFGNLLKLVTNQDIIPILVQESFENLFEAVAWFGDKAILQKLMDRSTNQIIYEAISKALLAQNDGANNAASSLLFNREIFDSLIVSWVKIIGNLPETNRAENVIDCFLLLIKAEKSFIDSINQEIVSEIQQTIEVISERECLKVTNSIFKHEIEDEDTPKLEKFPVCWSFFSRLCGRISCQLNNHFMKGMSQDEKMLLVQSFFWLGEEKYLVKFCNALYELHEPSIARQIIAQRKTAELALNSKHGLSALDELMGMAMEDYRHPHTSNLRALRKKIFTSLANRTEISIEELLSVLTIIEPCRIGKRELNDKAPSGSPQSKKAAT